MHEVDRELKIARLERIDKDRTEFSEHAAELILSPYEVIIMILKEGSLLLVQKENKYNF